MIRKKKGFTLIELLGVIVILAIIALVLIPVIGNLIESAKKSVAIRSIDGYIAAANDAAAISLVDNNGIALTDEKIEFETGNDDTELTKIDTKGNLPSYIYIKFDYEAKRVSEGKFCIDDYSVDYIDGLGSSESTLNYCGEGMNNAGLNVSITDKDILINLSSRPGVIEYCIANERSVRFCTWEVVRNHVVDYELTDSNIHYLYGRNSVGQSIYLYTIGKNTNTSFCDRNVGDIWYFTYDSTKTTGQKFEVPCDGIYKIELWGAQGGTGYYTGALGGYTKGEINLTYGEDLYFYVGSQPTGFDGGYNGGGDTKTFTYNGSGSKAAGGGATDVRYFGDTTPTNDELVWNSSLGLNSRIMVAGGGGSGDYYESRNCFGAGGAGGGLNGCNGTYAFNSTQMGKGGTQTAGGDGNNPGKFGYATAHTSGETVSSGTGGGGYYGGSSTHYRGSGGGGGSSFISGHAGCLAIKEGSTTEPRAIKDGCTASSTTRECSIHYSGLAFNENTTTMIDGEGYAWTTTKAGTSTGMPTYDGTSIMTGNSGNGYAKITYISE